MPTTNLDREVLYHFGKAGPLDPVIVMGEAQLRQLLRAYAGYTNTYPTHLGFDKGTRRGRPVQHRGRITSMPQLGGLEQAWVRI